MFQPAVFEGTIKQVGIVSTRMPNLGPSCLYDGPTGPPCVSRHAQPGPPNFLLTTFLSEDQWRQQIPFFNICSNLSLSPILGLGRQNHTALRGL